MSRILSQPILYLITRGATAETTSRASPEFQDILLQIKAAAAAEIDLIQIREKRLGARVLFELAERAVEITRGTSTRILINDRADIAAGAGAHGVHLTTESLDVAVVRNSFGDSVLIGASTHSREAAHQAFEQGADFIVLGPIFPTRSKEQYGPPLGLQKLSEVCGKLGDFPVLALGGVSERNADGCFAAGASGIAGISLFSDLANLKDVAGTIRAHAKEFRVKGYAHEEVRAKPSDLE